MSKMKIFSQGCLSHAGMVCRFVAKMMTCNTHNSALDNACRRASTLAKTFCWMQYVLVSCIHGDCIRSVRVSLERPMIRQPLETAFLCSY